MNSFEQLQTRHEELLSQQDSEAEILDQVREYITQARRAGTMIGSPQERDQLRANLRYWSGYVYEHTDVYPNAELAPAARNLKEDSNSNLPWYGWLMVTAIALVSVSVLALIVIFTDDFIPAEQATLPPDVMLTLTAPAMTDCIVQPPPDWITYQVQPGDTLFGLAFNTGATVDEVSQVNCLHPEDLLSRSTIYLPAESIAGIITPIRTPTLAATAAPTLAFTATPTATPEPIMTPTVDTGSIAVELTSLQDGEEVRPRTAVSGNYRNLRPGWSIHVLLQPISQGGRYFPAEQFETVAPNVPSGEWHIEIPFGEGVALERSEQYNISLVVATDDAGRDLLQTAVAEGFDDIPIQLIPYPQITTVRRGAYYHISETRLVYAEFFPQQNNNELVTTRPDGSDRQRLTFTPGASEFDPHISPTGDQIVYIRQETVDGVSLSSIWIMDSDGQNQTQLLAEPETIYERPVWSPDGRFIAYSATISRRFSQIFLYNMDTGDIIQLTANPFNSRFPSWLPAGDALIYNSFTPVPGSPGVSNEALFRLDLESLESSLLFDDPRTSETHPAVSPDGTAVAYTSRPIAGTSIIREIFVLDLATLEARQLTANGNDQFPRWHPDGETVYFESFLTAIWAVNAAGTNLRQITAEGESGHSRPDVGFLEAFLPLEQ
jgi:hypothetical protein